MPASASRPLRAEDDAIEPYGQHDRDDRVAGLVVGAEYPLLDQIMLPGARATVDFGSRIRAAAEGVLVLRPGRAAIGPTRQRAEKAASVGHLDCSAVGQLCTRFDQLDLVETTRRV